MYLFTAHVVHREKDNFKNGCDFDSSVIQFFGSDLEELTIEGGSLKELVKNICKHFNVDLNSVLLNSCDELGRLDVQTYTKGTNAIKCSYNKYSEGFKDGKFDLYLNSITGTVTTSDPLNLCAIWKDENKTN